jgi:hypothetical protein
MTEPAKRTMLMINEIKRNEKRGGQEGREAMV